MTVILFGNILTIVAVVRFYHLQTITNKFVVNLAASDIMVGVVLLYHSMLYIIPVLIKQKLSCLFFTVATSIPLMTSVINMAMISVDRYVAIVHPLRYPSIMTSRRTTIAILLPWIYNTLFACTIFFLNTWSSKTPACRLIDLATDNYLYALVIMQFFVPVMVIFTSYVLILKEVHKVNKRQVHLRLPPGVSTHSMGKITKATKTLFIVIGLFLVCWTPYFLYIFIICSTKRPNNVTIYNIFIFLGLINSCLNPIVYGWKNKDFRKAFKTLLRLQKHSDEIASD